MIHLPSASDCSTDRPRVPRTGISVNQNQFDSCSGERFGVPELDVLAYLGPFLSSTCDPSSSPTVEPVRRIYFLLFDRLILTITTTISARRYAKGHLFHINSSLLTQPFSPSFSSAAMALPTSTSYFHHGALDHLDHLDLPSKSNLGRFGTPPSPFFPSQLLPDPSAELPAPGSPLSPRTLYAQCFDRPLSSRSLPSGRFRKNMKDITGFGTTEEEFEALPIAVRRKVRLQ